MKIRTALAALAAVATLTLTACSSETAGTAAPVTGADGVAPAASADPDGTDGTDGPDAAPSEDAPTGESTTEDAPTDEPTTVDPTTEDPGTVDPTTDGGDQGGGDSTPNPDACQQLLTLAQDFSSKIVQKAAQGGVTQEDVDEVFSDANMAALPPELQADAATLKDLSQQMVGKEIIELAEILPKVQTTFESIVAKADTVC